jgi:hypothetical protein
LPSPSVSVCDGLTAFGQLSHVAARIPVRVGLVRIRGRRTVVVGVTTPSPSTSTRTKVAVTWCWLAVIVSDFGFWDPVRSPDQPEKLKPAAGTAVSSTTSPHR